MDDEQWRDMVAGMSSWRDREAAEQLKIADDRRASLMAGIVETSTLRRLVARMQRTHERRRASFFVGPPGIGKSTAIRAFLANNPGEVIVVKNVMKMGATGVQALQQLLVGLRSHQGSDKVYTTNARAQINQEIDQRLAAMCERLGSDAKPDDFPKLTVVFDEAQRLTRDAIDSLRDYNEPHFQCRGPFPLGMIFVGNNELSLQVSSDGKSVLDHGMDDRLLFRDRLSYDDVERGDLESFVRSLGIGDNRAIDAIVTTFTGQFARQRSFRRVSDFVDDLRDEAGDRPITQETVRAVLGLV